MNENKNNRSKEVALYQDICLSILKISDSIRYVGIINRNENVTFLLIPQITKDILYYITIEKDAELNEINEIINDIFIKIK